jgi:regulatory protein
MDGQRRGRGGGWSGGAGGSRGGQEPTEPVDPVTAARETCLRLLTVRPRSRAELEAALLRRRFDSEVVEGILGRLTDVGLIDDAAFAEAFVSWRQGPRGLGRGAIAHQLRRRGVDKETVASAVAVITVEDELESAREHVRRRLSATLGLEPHVRARRLAAALARRGYPATVVATVVREALEIDEEFAFDEVDPVD